MILTKNGKFDKIFISNVINVLEQKLKNGNQVYNIAMINLREIVLLASLIYISHRCS